MSVSHHIWQRSGLFCPVFLLVMGFTSVKCSGEWICSKCISISLLKTLPKYHLFCADCPKNPFLSFLFLKRIKFSSRSSLFCGVVMCCRIVEEGLSYRFHASWPFVLQILGCFYRASGKQAHPVMMKVRDLTLTSVLCGYECFRHWILVHWGSGGPVVAQWWRLWVAGQGFRPHHCQASADLRELRALLSLTRIHYYVTK